ncbi:zinc-dependent metalloprotease [Cytophagaceae bacterium YF14B1]|uniref:Zinc-dependent metalloprotease n=1 Tax=Xanthocytophaga flava TaxID=3048013 RepID=A0AAE3U6C2_9BACT|nr:zinc-dependent metalloprotease [Xanthocytophaga flavus]MDJ1478923.1 zinc-dependent metalloprotease [Xanthocytophaga flavus]
MKKSLILLYAVIIGFQVALAQKKASGTESAASSLSSATQGAERMEGFIPFYWDAKKGKIFLEISRFDTEFLYYPSLASGIGSNDIGLDRGRLSQEHVVKFQRSGNKVLLIESNYAYRAISKDPLEQQAVTESFAQSVHWGFEVMAEENGKVLVDATNFFIQDAVGAIQAISRTKQGNFRIDPSRCAFYLPHTKNFPQNTEVEATITLVGDQPGGYLQEVVPTPTMITMRQHYSFVQLPELETYKPRIFDPRSGMIPMQYFDYATPVSEPIIKRFIIRHRLEKKDPTATVSEAVKPIVYYMDPGAPEPIRSALMEGTVWWNQAFEAAGYKDAFQVKLLPADADPMDVRYNVIQWVHRSTRGWSYGSSIIDPRTGEILKGKVTLGSLRVRQDFLIAQGLVAAYEEGKPVSEAMMKMALSRLRQLAAHEVGHTLGLPHNYIASTNDRASVMDYPHPLVDIKGNNLELSNAYATGIGEWDKVAINYAYQDFPKGTDEKTALDKILSDYIKKGLYFLSDQDARPEGSAHPTTHLWDNGKSAAEELNRMMQIRKIALDHFSEKKIPVGSPMATLEEVLVPMYMFHRYQTEATAKVIGGAFYTYAARGDSQKIYEPVSASDQKQALTALLATIKPEALVVPDKVLKLIPPRAFGYDANPREVFKGRTGLTFDPLGPAEAAAGMTLRLLFNPERASRLVSQQAIDSSLPSLADIIENTYAATWKSNTKNGYTGEVSRIVNNLVLKNIIQLAANKNISEQARAIANLKVNELKTWLSASVGKQTDVSWKAHYLFALNQISEYEQKGAESTVVTPLTPPDGAPIDPGYEWLDMDMCSWENSSR